MVRGRSTKTISMIKCIRTSRFSIKNSFYIQGKFDRASQTYKEGLTVQVKCPGKFDPASQTRRRFDRIGYVYRAGLTVQVKCTG